MKKIKLFEEFNSNSDIDTICKKYGIKNYTINEDGTVDVNGDVKIVGGGLKKLPLKFNKVTGYFNISYNSLTTLEGCPEEVGSFSCFSNKLTTLEGGPKEVHGDFSCGSNKLETLKGSPNSIGGDFYCSFNNLTSLEGCTTKIGGDVQFNYNPVLQVWDLIDDKEYLEIFLDYDMIDGKNLYLSRLNDILDIMGKSRVTKVKGYKCI